MSGNVFDNPMLKSLVLPGWGEASVGAELKSRQFLFREGLLWLSFAGSGWTQSHYERAYIQFAHESAGIDLNQQSYQFSVDVGNYDSLEDYNLHKARRRQYDLLIDETIPGNKWEWNSAEDRKHYDQMRIASGLAGKTQSFVIAGLIGHRILSMINVLYLERMSGVNADLNLSKRGNPQLILSLPLY